MGVGGLVLKSEQKWHISALNYRKKKRTLKSHRQKFKINSRQPHKNRSRSTGVSWHARWAPRNSSCYGLVSYLYYSFVSLLLLPLKIHKKPIIIDNNLPHHILKCSVIDWFFKFKYISIYKAKIDNYLCVRVAVINKRASSEEEALCFKEQAVLIILQLKLF